MTLRPPDGTEGGPLTPPEFHSQGTARPAGWFHSSVIYEIPIRSFFDSNGDGIGDIPGLIEKLGYVQELGVQALWLLPFYPSPWRDEGYDVTDHYSVHPKLGTLADIDRLVSEAHSRGLRVLADFVMNHVSDQHPWFQQARRGPDSPYRSWFLWSDTTQGFSRAPIIYPDFAPSNWTWDDAAQQYYFHRFFSFQPDLNYDEPKVRAEMFRVAEFWLDRGFDGFRCDAAPYLFKREGTRCASLPETHQFFRELRARMQAGFPGTVLMSEANQSVPETVPYFGEGKEFSVVLHFPLMPNLFLAYEERNPERIVDVLRATLPAPEPSRWGYFLRNHDELSLEHASPGERKLLLSEYAPEARFRLHHGIRRRLAPLLHGDDSAVLLLSALILSLPGTTLLYYGDEIGMGDRPDLSDRDGVRTPMQWTAEEGAGFSRAAPGAFVRPLVEDPAFAPIARNVADQSRRADSLLNRTRQLLALRHRHSLAFASQTFRVLEPRPRPVLAFVREDRATGLLFAYNFSSQPVTWHVASTESFPDAMDLIHGVPVAWAGRTIELSGHDFLWWRYAPEHGPSQPGP